MSDAVTLEREVDVAFEKIPEPFYINEQAEVNIAVQRLQNVVKIPASVVVQSGGKLGVWIAKDAHAHFVAIEKIGQSDTEVAVKNITPSMQIIVPNAKKKRLKDWMKIHL